MTTCKQAALTFSTCGKRQYFAVILDSYGHVLGTGWNGGPPGAQHCNEGGCPRFSEGSAPGSNYDNCIAIHAEQNALLHSNYTDRRDGCTLLVNGPPCYGCAKLLVNGGITRLVYITDDSYVAWPQVAEFLITHGVKLVPIPSNDR